MNQFFSHVIVSLLMVSLLLSGCYSTRSLAGLAERDAVTIEQARYDALWMIPREQLSAAEVAERDRLQRTQLERVLVREASEQEFHRPLLLQRDSIILNQARYELLSAAPDSELGQAEAAELAILQRQQAERDSTLDAVEAVLKDRHLSELSRITLTFFGLVVALAAIAAATWNGSIGLGP